MDDSHFLRQYQYTYNHSNLNTTYSRKVMKDAAKDSFPGIYRVCRKDTDWVVHGVTFIPNRFSDIDSGSPYKIFIKIRCDSSRC